MKLVFAFAFIALAVAVSAGRPNMGAFEKDPKLRGRQEESSNAYYVMIKNSGTIEDANQLASTFHTRLGSDPNVEIVAASPRKLVVKLTNSDAALADRITSALRSFQEVKFVENRPRYALKRNPVTNAIRRDSQKV